MKLSIVTTLYKSAPYIAEFYSRISAEAKKITEDFEIVFVDDGSPDHSLTEVVRLQKTDPKVVAVELSRNFGHHKAILTGLENASGDYILVIDSDLEEPPELLGLFWQELNRDPLSKPDLVYGVQNKRKGKTFERLSGQAFYYLFNKLSSTPVPRDCMIAKLMTRQFLEELVRYKDRSVFLGGLVVLTGFKQVPVYADKKFKGSTTYSLSIKLNQMLNSITSFSSRPLFFVFYIGLTLFCSSAVFALLLVIKYFMFSSTATGWTSLIVSLYMLAGFILLCVGVVGIYLAKIFEEVKDRPYTSIKRVWRAQ